MNTANGVVSNGCTVTLIPT